MYNCEKQIPRVLQKCSPEIQEQLTEILIVDNGSKDNGVAAANQWIAAGTLCKARVVQNIQNVSLGGSHKVAFNYAIEQGFDFCIVCHGDDQGDIRNLFDVLKTQSLEGLDALLGARFHKQSTLVGYSFVRIFGNRVVNMLMSFTTGYRVLDVGSGLNMYRVSSLKTQFYMPFPNTLNFNIFLVLYQIWQGHRIQFFPITWREDDQISNAKMWRQGLQILKLLLHYKCNPSQIFTKKYADPDLVYAFEERK